MVKVICCCILLLIVSCTSKKFEKYRPSEGVILGKSIWEHGNFSLEYRSKDIGMSETLFWLSFEKVENGDTIGYRLWHNKIASRDYMVYNDTLYLQNGEDGTCFSSWYVKDSLLAQVEEDYILTKYKIDTIALKKLHNGIYKWEKNTFVKIYNESDKWNTIKEQKLNGVYYLAPPGIGVKYKYSLIELEKNDW